MKVVFILILIRVGASTVLNITENAYMYVVSIHYNDYYMCVLITFEPRLQ